MDLDEFLVEWVEVDFSDLFTDGQQHYSMFLLVVRKKGRGWMEYKKKMHKGRLDGLLTFLLTVKEVKCVGLT